MRTICPGMKALVAACAAAAALAVFAYLPPVDERCGVRVEIGSFPQKIEQNSKNPFAWPLGVTEVKAGAPRAFPVTLENKTGRPVAGELEVWMNDDWDVAGPQGPLTLAPGEKKELSYTGTSRPRALNALYPVHARFTPAGARKEDAPHPIAVFMYRNPNAPRPVRKAAIPRPGSGAPQPKAPDEADWKTRCATALAAAQAARTSGTDAAAGHWRLEAGDAAYGAGVAYGARGLVDGALAFTDGSRSVVFRGFTARVDAGDGSAPPEAKASIREENGTLRISWSIPGATRDAAGFPRIVDLAVGPASETPHRVYMGFGNVVEGPKKFTLHANGFGLSTRHVGADYANGLSVVQAVDVVQDSVRCDGEKNLFALHAHHDATFTFVPSSKGAFDAARRFRAVAGYRASPGLAALGSRMCLDQWGGDYAKAAEDLAKAAKYGLNDSIFVKHVWQRWGYDYRLPEIYPPAGDAAAFGAMRDACRAAGILFCPHDNYTDIYPDCDGYTYDLTVFNLDGTPQLAFFNPSRHARSYRWAPHAFHPWCLRNAKLLKEGYDPDAIFIDVFTALGPFDYLDREGRFHSKNETSANWGRGFTLYRQGFRRPDAVCVSEAGQDHLVGVADAGQSDHFGAPKLIGRANFADSERTPWHDIATHGLYVLFAGGLGGRYLEEDGWHKGGDAELHGYGSDDYLSNCIIGGRSPMCDGPFSRNAVKTYWLQHDACAELGRAEFLDLKYEGGIHRQHSFFSNGGEVWSNRDTGRTWLLPNGVALPPYGYYARTRSTESGVVEKDGVRCSFAKSAGGLFVDARKPPAGRSRDAVSRPLRAETPAPGRLRVFVAWETRRALAGYEPFVHVCTPGGPREGIVFYGSMEGAKEAFARVGGHELAIDVRIPHGAPAGTYTLRYGAWRPADGARLVVGGAPSDGARRLMGGAIEVSRTDGGVPAAAWRPDGLPEKVAARERLIGANRAGRAVDFGGVKTDGSFRFADWTITPLPDSEAFSAEIDLAAFGAAGRVVAGVDTVEPEKDAAAPTWSQSGNVLKVACDSKSFAYRIRLR